jgi:hypothetical protein
MVWLKWEDWYFTLLIPTISCDFSFWADGKDVNNLHTSLGMILRSRIFEAVVILLLLSIIFGTGVMQTQVIVLAYLESQCTKFHATGWMYWFLCFYVHFIWCDISMVQRQICPRVCANLGKSTTETPAIIRQAFGEETMICTQVFQWKNPDSLRLKKGKTGEEQSQEHAHNVLWHQEDSLQRIWPDRQNSQFCILQWLHENVRRRQSVSVMD